MTILYASDFKKYPRAIVDINSPNRSWVEFAGKLKQMGVKNWGFHLTLLDPTLQGVDPFDPNLDSTTILKIKFELENNWWYYLREFFKVPSTAGDVPMPLRANRGNIAMFWSVFNSFITYNQQIRQTGKSLNTRALVTGWHTAWMRGSQHLLFTKTDLRPDEIKYYKSIKGSLPGYMYYNTAKDKDNQQDFTTLCNGNVTFSYTPSSDENLATNVGRGKTPNFITVDEVPFLAYCYISIPAMIAATSASFDEARALGAFHSILYTTTAGDLSSKGGKYVYENIKDRGYFFSEMLYDCMDRPDAVEMILANSNSRTVPYVTIAFNHRQLGYTDDWLREKIDSVPGTKDQIKRDFLGIWTYGSQENPIPENILNIIRRHANSDFHAERYNTYYVVRFQKDMEYVRQRKAVLGLDMSEAIGRDSITGVCVDVETAETLFAFQVRESNLIYFGNFLAKFMEQFPNITLMPENKSTFSTLRDQLLIELPMKGIDPGRRIYSDIVDNANGSESDKRTYRDYSQGYPTERKYAPYRRDFGFNTSKASRDELFRDVMMNVVRDIPRDIKDPVLIDELSSLVERKGRIDHAMTGEVTHDDHVISFALAHWLLRKGRNLEHYGIDPARVMCSVVTEKLQDPSEMKKKNEVDKILGVIAELEARLDTSTNAIEIAYLEAKLKIAKGEVSDVDDITQHTSSLAAQSAMSKKTRKRRAGGLRPMFSNSPFR